MAQRKPVRTELNEKDQLNLLKFLESPSGKRVMAWLLENGPGAIQTAKESDYAFLYGLKSGFEYLHLELRSIPGRDLSEINPEPKNETGEEI